MVHLLISRKKLSDSHIYSDTLYFILIVICLFLIITMWLE